jgi:hypothetical protein
MKRTDPSDLEPLDNPLVRRGVNKECYHTRKCQVIQSVDRERFGEWCDERIESSRLDECIYCSKGKPVNEEITTLASDIRNGIVDVDI